MAQHRLCKSGDETAFAHCDGVRRFGACDEAEAVAWSAVGLHGQTQGESPTEEEDGQPAGEDRVLLRLPVRPNRAF